MTPILMQRTLRRSLTVKRGRVTTSPKKTEVAAKQAFGGVLTRHELREHRMCDHLDSSVKRERRVCVNFPCAILFVAYSAR